MFPGPLAHGVIGAALTRHHWRCTVLDIRQYAKDRHRTVDDTPYGGGAGMIMKPDVVSDAIEAAYVIEPKAKLVYFTAQGARLDQAMIQALSDEDVSAYILLCGRFEGVDTRLLEYYRPMEISVGDYILCGGELPAMVWMEACLRYVPGILGNQETLQEESFSYLSQNSGLLEYPQYTRPSCWNGMQVPEILCSGNHAAIARWREESAENMTRSRRPDIWRTYCASKSASTLGDT